MIPYFEQPRLPIGPVTIYGYGVLVLTAILVGWRLTVWRARRVGLDPETASRLAQYMVMAGFAGAWVARTQIYARGEWTGFSSFGGLAGGLLAGWFVLRRTGRIAQYFDAIAAVFPIAWIIGRTGCFVAHDHPGIRSESWIAVRYPGGARFDLGLLEALFMIPVALLFLLLGRRLRPPGFFTGLFLTIYGPFRIALDQLHENPPTADTWFGIAATLAGVGVLASSLTAGRRGATDPDR